MTGRGRGRAVIWALVPLGLLVAFAFVAAPHACAWGLGAYTVAGLVTVLAMATVPWGAGPVLRSRGWSSLLGAITALLVWAGMLVLADFQLLCRLF